MALLILNIFIHIVSISFALLVVARIYSHVQKYRFEKSAQDRLLKLFHFRWVVWIYLVVILSSAVASSLIIYSLNP
jgi:hypothetical protein